MNTRETAKIVCPVCGKTQVGEYDICEICNWENDPIQFRNPNFSGGANRMSLLEAKEAYRTGKPVR